MKKSITGAVLFALVALAPGLAEASCEGFRGRYTLSALGCYTINHGNHNHGRSVRARVHFRESSLKEGAPNFS